MRLLNTRTLIVEDFYGYSVPPYAILSHTWGSDEVTFQDIQNLEIARLKAGFTKIVYACAQAFRDHLQYTWIDTCCIDKTSSSELSEAINSMYDWYRDSRICYVYLSDVKKDGGDFTRSRWFTRGWTLQELLAPNQVLFFDCKWTRIMNKGSNAHEISIVTGIDSSVLRGLTDIQSQSVAQRMSWMATRTTTRLEDIAYSMLGIFDVHMPLIYGEGRLAFIRLQQEIIRQSNDDSIFAWDDSKFRNPGSPYDGLLAPRPSAFASSGLIVQCPSSIRGSLFRPGSSIAFTNRGLQFHGRPLLEDDVGTPNFQSALMPLACNNSTDNDNSILAVPLTLLPETGHWARAVSRPLHRIDRAVLGYSKNETKSFYTLGSGQYSLRNADYSYTQEKASYDLTARYDSSSALLRALAKLFPSSTIPVQFRIGVYHIELPRKLTPTEEKQLRDTVLAGSHYTRIQEQNERYSDLQHTAQKGDLQGKKQDLLGSLHGSSPTVPEYIPGRPIPILAPDPGRSPGSKAYKFLNLSDADKSGYTWGLYAQSIETGESSTVFQVNAMTSLGKIMGPGATTSPLTVKIAIKRLDHDIAPSYFLREYKALQGITSLDHDNIVEVLCVFRTELEEHQYYNFGFPLALGNLKRLFRGDYNSEITIMSHTQSLWTQFEGLANALVFLHETLHMAHRDIKPSNILFYWDKSGTNLVLRIADFGLSVDLTSAIAIEKESKAASSPWSYDSPEFRNAHSSKIDAGLPSASEVLSNDIWKLGCVFVELETFLALNGSAGITKLREHITTTVSTEHAEFESDTFEDFRFDDGERVKPEVMNWIQKVLPSNHEWAIQLGPILGKMLCGSSQRWSARTVYRGLLKAEFSPTIYYFDGIRRLTVSKYQPSGESWLRKSMDEARIRIEYWLGCGVDWSPLRPVEYLRSSQQVKISWKRPSRELFAVISRSKFEEYIRACMPFRRDGKPMLPTITHPPQLPITPRIDSSFSALSETTLGDRGEGILVNERSDVEVPKPKKQLDLHLCVNKQWEDPVPTFLNELHSIQEYTSDEELYLELRRRMRHAEGWRRLLSWKSCRDVDFVEFFLVRATGKKVYTRAITALPDPLPGYEHGVRDPHDISMKLAAIDIVAGLECPADGRERRDMIGMLPKKQVPPSLERKSGAQGWGIRPRYGFAVWKFVLWILLTQILGFGIVAFWLVYVNNGDLQNAFVPLTFFTSLVMIVLGLPQVVLK